MLAKVGLLEAYLAELQSDAARYVAFAEDHDFELSVDHPS